jgi:hypothetical protein
MTTLATPEATTPAAIPAHAVPRFDMYASIHKALRSLMCDTLLQVGRMDVSDPAELDATLDRVEMLLAFCLDHIERENGWVHTAIEARRPAGAARTAHDHEEHFESIAALRGEVATVAAAAPQVRPMLAQRLYQHLALFVAENFQHMHIEETANNAALWALYTDAELHDIHGRLLAAIPPAKELQIVRWMIPACSPMERAAIVGHAKTQMPPEALLGVLAHVRPHIDGSGWLKLAAAVGVSPTLGLAA